MVSGSLGTQNRVEPQALRGRKFNGNRGKIQGEKRESEGSSSVSGAEARNRRLPLRQHSETPLRCPAGPIRAWCRICAVLYA